MSDQQTEKQKQNPWDETIKTILIAIILAVTFRSFAFEPFHIPSESMESTLLVGDYLFVSKYSYGYSRYSFPFGLPPFQGRILEFAAPQRGDIVVFRPPSNPRVDFIKRVMGLPGEHIQVKEGIVYINGKALPRRQLTDYADTKDPHNVQSIERYAETLPEGKVITILKERGTNGDFANNTPDYIVPEGHYFMMGDNRDHSSDSRFANVVGFVPAENLVGHAQLIWFSTDGTAEWINPVSWFSAMRFDRFFQILD